MADSGVIQYATTQLAYGIGTTPGTITAGGASIILQSAQVGSEGESKTYKDNTGVTAALVIPETYQTLQCEGLLVKGQSVSIPKKGDAVSSLPAGLGLTTSGTWRIESFTTSWSNEDVTKVSFQLRNYRF